MRNIVKTESGYVKRIDGDFVNNTSGNVWGYDGNVWGSVNTLSYHRSDIIIENDKGENVLIKDVLSSRKTCVESDKLVCEYFDSGIVVLRNLTTGLKFMINEGDGNRNKNILEYYDEENILLDKETSLWQAGIFLFLLSMICTICINVNVIFFMFSIFCATIVFVICMFLININEENIILNLLDEDDMDSIRKS